MNQFFRPEQTAYANQIGAALTNRKDAIMIAEGGTGVGKTRVALSTAIKHLAAGNERRVVIAVPQIKHLHQFMTEWATVFAPDHTSIRISAMIGRAQFVDPDAIDKIFALGYADDAVLTEVASQNRTVE